MKFIIVVAFLITLTWARPQRFDDPFAFQQFPGNNNGNAISTTTAAPNTVTTASPQYLACLQSCPSTMEYNPVCGTDSINYHNTGRLNCAQRCGKDVASVRLGTCSAL